MDSLELTEGIVPEKKVISKKLKGLEVFQFESEEDIEMMDMIIPEPALKKNQKPKVINVKKKDAIF